MCLLSVDFRLGTTCVGLPRLRMPPTREYHYRGGSALRLSTRAHIRQSRPRVIAGSFIFSRRMI
uniref:Uncharacterized protein n=1 Tax=Podoviridae sp. ctaUh10 TaxID=2826563 RepID=A0A8S5QRB4_9CAUD|nr:MAG TPA: hypothetical protein [Podoviridae sp. ctaUh10]